MTELKPGTSISIRTNLLVFGGFFLFFFLVFLQYPLSGSLTGNTDTWYNLAMFNDYGNRIAAFFTGAELGNADYPEAMMQRFAEPYLGEAFTYLFWRMFGFGYLWAYFLFIVTTYALNGFGAYLLIRRATKAHWSAVAGGFAFAASTFAFSQVELLNGIGWHTALFCLYFYDVFLEKRTARTLAAAMLLGGLQVYTSAYVFTYQCLLLIAMTLIYGRDLLKSVRGLASLGLAIFGMALTILPFAWFYIFDSLTTTSWNPIADDPKLIENFSLKFSDLFRSFSHNLVYPQLKHIEYETLMRNHNYANIGIFIWALAIFAFFKKPAGRLFWSICFILGFIFAVGPVLELGGFRLPMPLKLLYDHTALSDFLRIPARAFSLTVLGLAGLAAGGLKIIGDKFPGKDKWLAMAFMLIFTVENVPWKFEKVDATRFIQAPEPYLDFLSQQPASTVVANFPSGLFTENQDYVAGISVFSREYIYSHWQTQYKTHTLNGSCGFFPESRIRNNDLMKDISEGNNLSELIELNGVNFVVHHENLVLSDREKEVLPFLLQAPQLELVREAPPVHIFKVIAE